MLEKWISKGFSSVIQSGHELMTTTNRNISLNMYINILLVWSHFRDGLLFFFSSFQLFVVVICKSTSHHMHPLSPLYPLSQIFQSKTLFIKWNSLLCTFQENAQKLFSFNVIITYGNIQLNRNTQTECLRPANFKWVLR